MKVGDKVVCIKKGGWAIYQSGAPTKGVTPKYGETYTIRILYKTSDGTTFLKFTEIERGWSQIQFRKVQPAKTNRVTRELVREFKEVEERIEQPKKVEL